MAIYITYVRFICVCYSGVAVFGVSYTLILEGWNHLRVLCCFLCCFLLDFPFVLGFLGCGLCCTGFLEVL